MKIAFIGGGKMGEAVLAAVLNSLPGPHGISLCDVSDQRRIAIEQKYGSGYAATSLKTTSSNQQAARGADVVVMAVKPQDLAVVMAGLNGNLEANQLVISIIAGATIETLVNGLGHHCIVRAMPNTPARIGEGMSAWTATAGVSAAQKEMAGAILGAMGREIYFDDEKYLDMATAVSGSGPAYFFLLAEAMADAAVKTGLPPAEAGQMVSQTMLGAARLLQASGRSPAELRRDVTSPGGTTAAALDVMTEGGFSELVVRAVAAAYRRAQELGK